MKRKRTNYTSKEEIVEFWSKNKDESELSIDFSEGMERCWRCAYKSKLEKCHIIPHSLGGLDEPRNFVLLCKLCHAEGPNVSDPEIFWDWLKAHKVNFYETYWHLRGLKEYQFLYGKSPVDEFIEIGIPEDKIYMLLEDEIQKCSWHFGQPRLNSSTIAGLYRIILKRLRVQK